MLFHSSPGCKIDSMRGWKRETDNFLWSFSDFSLKLICPHFCSSASQYIRGQMTKKSIKSYAIPVLHTNAHTHQRSEKKSTPCCCVTGQEGEGPTEKQGSGCHISTNAAFYMRLMALWNIPSAKSDLALFLPFIPAVKVWVPCHNCGSVISPSQYPGRKKKRQVLKTKDEIYGFTTIHW